jgi:protein-arginine kinase
MIKTKILLYILLFNKTSLEFEVVSLEKNKLVVPECYVDSEENVEKQIKDIFEKYVDLSSEFTSFILNDVFIENKELIIQYYCLIPYGVETKNSNPIKINAQETNSNNLRKVLLSL